MIDRPRSANAIVELWPQRLLVALAIAFIRLAQEVPNCELLALSFFRALEEMEFARSRVGPVRRNR